MKETVKESSKSLPKVKWCEWLIILYHYIKTFCSTLVASSLFPIIPCDAGSRFSSSVSAVNLPWPARPHPLSGYQDWNRQWGLVGMSVGILLWSNVVIHLYGPKFFMYTECKIMSYHHNYHIIIHYYLIRACSEPTSDPVKPLMLGGKWLCPCKFKECTQSLGPFWHGFCEQPARSSMSIRNRVR